MKRLYKKALISLNADDMRETKTDENESLDSLDKGLDKDLDTDLDIDLDKNVELDKKPDLTKEVEDKTDITFDKKPEFEQPEVTPESVNQEFGVDSPGMGVDLVTLEEGLLNDLSSLNVLYQQTKFFHWIISDENYIATHRFLDEVATGILQTIDLIAERLVYIGTTPVADLEQIKFRSYVQFQQLDGPFKLYRAVDTLDSQFSLIIDKLKDNSKKANQKDDIGTDKLLQDLVYDLETFQHHIRSFK